MEYVVGLVLIVVGYMWLRSRGRQKEERVALRRFEYTKRLTDNIGLDWTVDFVEMKAIIKGYDWDGVPEGSAFEQPTLYSLRRREGEWQLRITDQSRAIEEKCLAASIKKGAGGSALLEDVIEDQKKELEALQDPQWGPIDDEIAGPLETQYQRFVVHYREN